MIEDDFPALPPLRSAGAPVSFRAQASDIDLNDHVNNTVYLDWALRAIQGEARRKKPRSLEAAFLGEARLGDEILCRGESAAGDGGVIFLQSLQDAVSGRELNRLRWRF
jgi:medium-chain acyl-[acyl-carrier-protein] hydrolase